MKLHYTSNYVVLLLHSRLYQGRTGHTQATNIIKINTRPAYKMVQKKNQAKH